MRAIAGGALLICLSALLGGQAENQPGSRQFWIQQWDRNTGRITISFPTARIFAATSHRVSPPVMLLKDAVIETEGMILKAEEVKLTIGTMEATVRGAHLKFEKRK